MVQVFEWLAVGLFLLGFIIGTVEMIMHPARFRKKEIHFFQDHRNITALDGVLFVLAGASFIFLMLHFIFEQLVLSQAFSYLMIVAYASMFPFFFFSRSFSRHMLKQARKKTPHQYYVHALARLLLIAFMIISPVVA